MRRGEKRNTERKQNLKNKKRGKAQKENNF